MTSPRDLPPELLTAPFTTAAARALGVTDQMLGGRRFRRLHHGVLVSAEVVDSPALRRSAALLVVPPTAAFSEVTAVQVYGLPLGINEVPDRRPHVSVPADGPLPDRLGLHVHVVALPPEHVIVVDGWPVTTPARTFLDRAVHLDLPELVALGDVIVRRSLATMHEVGDLLVWADRRRGVVRARQAFELLDPRSASPLESQTRVVLVLGGLPKPECNVDIFDEHGGWLARGDLVYRRQRVVIEYDGAVHNDERRRRADLRRRNLLTAAGWTVLIFSADDVLRRPHLVVAQVRAALEAADRRLAAA